MSSVLSQNEVDALLKGISGGEFDMEDSGGEALGDEDVIPYDLTSQDRIIRGRMPTLEIIHDRFVRHFRLTLSSALRKVVDISVRSTELIKFGEFLKTLPVPSSLNLFRMPTLEIIHDRFVRHFRLTLSSALRKVVDISVRSTELIKFGEFLKTLPVPSSLNLFRMSPLRGNAIMVLETRLVFTLIDLFFGGTGELEVKAEGRDFSAIEQRMIKRVVISALEDLQQSWRPVFPVQITYTRSEVNPQFVAIVPHSEVVVVVTFDVEMGRAPMSVTLCIPYSMIEPIRAKLNAGFQSDQNEVDTTWLNRFRTNLQQAKVEVVAELGRAEINVREFLNLKVGDVVQLEQEVDKPLAVTVEGIAKFKGFQGSYKGHQALKVTEMVYKPPVVDEILLQ